MPRRKKAKRIGGAEKAALEQEKLTERWRTEIFLSLIFLSALSRQCTKRASHPEKAECRKPGQSHPKPHPCDIKAIWSASGRQPIATPEPPSSHPKVIYLGGGWEPQATPMRPSSHPHATPKPPQSHLKARVKPKPDEEVSGAWVAFGAGTRDGPSPKPEDRRPKEIRGPKPESITTAAEQQPIGSSRSRISAFFRVSGFGLRI